MDYIVCNRNAPNGATTFTLSGTLGGFSDATVTTISNSTNGSGPESIESILLSKRLEAYVFQN